MIFTSQVILLCQRAFGDPGFKRIFCVAHAEKLSYQVCDKVLRIFTKLSHGKLGQYWKSSFVLFGCTNWRLYFEFQATDWW